MSAGESKGISTSPWTATSPRPAALLEDLPPSHSPYSAPPPPPLVANLRLNVYGSVERVGNQGTMLADGLIKLIIKFWFYFYTHSIVSSLFLSLSLSTHTHNTLPLLILLLVEDQAHPRPFSARVIIKPEQ